MELDELEKRRAVNLIWNAARNYSFEPDFRAFDENGRAELYWNCIIGAVRYYFDWEKLSALFHTFSGTADQMLFENLMWLGLENAVYLREREARPALPGLREAYARRVVALSRAAASDRLLDAIEEAHFRRALGENPKMQARDRELLNALELGPELDTDQVTAQITDTFAKYLNYHPVRERREEEPHRRIPALFLLGQRRKGERDSLPPVRGFVFGLGEHTGEYGGTKTPRKSRSLLQRSFSTDRTEEELRDYISSYFGAPLYPQRQVEHMEKELCTGSHKGCHLHFTRGSFDGVVPPRGEAGAQKRAILKQVAQNRVFYQQNLARNRSSIDRLTGRIRNSMLTQLESTTVRAGSGKLVGGRIWRGVYLDDDRIFDRELRGDTGNLSVDILLDSSTSQLNRQEIVATQGYIIAESLTRCRLPVRVYSFCSMSGYTVVNLFRDYRETDKNENIFNYFTTGCNRDGLAVRVAADFLRKTECEHKLLILLSDAKPNDVIKVRTGENAYRDYTESVGVENTAAEVHRARMEGISVLCVFTGEDEDLPAARKIYGQDFTRIRSLGQFADTVGALIQNQIRNL